MKYKDANNDQAIRSDLNSNRRLAVFTKRSCPPAYFVLVGCFTQAIMSLDTEVLTYLGLPNDYHLRPVEEPIEFLRIHLRRLPPQLSCKFSSIITPKQRTVLSVVRNRRLNYTRSNPSELQFERARACWPLLWKGGGRRETIEGKEEKEWADKEFMAGERQHIGKLGNLLSDVAEELEMERSRGQTRLFGQFPQDDFIPEEDEDTDEEENGQAMPANESPEEMKDDFLRLIRERFIYGLLEVGLGFFSDEFENRSLYSPLIMMTSIGTIRGTKTMTETTKNVGLMKTTNELRSHPASPVSSCNFA